MPKKKKHQQTRAKKSAKKATKSRKKTTPKRKPRRIKAASKRSSLARKKVKFSAKRKRVTSTGLVVEAVPLPSGERPHLGGQAADLQGPSNHPTANSESVEEGNALEAEAVQGVENALDANQGEVEHEVPEDDAPEYLDKDR